MPTPPKLVVVTLIRTEDHPWDPNVIEYSVIQMIDGEPNFLHAGEKISPTVTASMTLTQVQALAEADATSRSLIP